MSKSYNNALELFEPAKVTKKKIMRIVTDSTPVEEPKDPEKCTVFALLQLVTEEQERQEWEERYRKGPMGYGEAKKRLAELTNEMLEPFRQRYEELSKDDNVKKAYLGG